MDLVELAGVRPVCAKTDVAVGCHGWVVKHGAVVERTLYMCRLTPASVRRSLYIPEIGAAEGLADPGPGGSIVASNDVPLSSGSLTLAGTALIKDSTLPLEIQLPPIPARGAASFDQRE